MKVSVVIVIVLLCVISITGTLNVHYYIQNKELFGQLKIFESDYAQLREQQILLESQLTSLTSQFLNLSGELTKTREKLTNLYSMAYNSGYNRGYDYGFVEGIATSYNLQISQFGLSTANVFGAVGESWQRSSFFAQGRFWKFYDDDVNLVYVSSVDGITWSSKTTIRPSRSPAYLCLFDLFYDKSTNRVHYVYADDGGDRELSYRVGTANSNGTILWVADEQAIRNGTNIQWGSPSLTIDSNGYPWIATTEHTDWENTLPYVAKSSTKNGFWTQEFWTQLTSTKANWQAKIHSLTEGRMYVIYVGNDQGYNNTMYGRLYDGEWRVEETVATDSRACAYSTVSDGDTIHMVWHHNYKKYSQGHGWSPTQFIGISANAVLSLDVTKGELYRFFDVGKTLYVQKGHNGIWIRESPLLFLEEDVNIESWEFSAKGKVGFTFSLGDNAPYEHYVGILRI